MHANIFFFCTEKGISVHDFEEDYSTPQKSSHVDGFFKSTELNGFLEKKKYSAFETTFFIAAFPDRVTRAPPSQC